jgi:hypothetical protein
LKKKSKQEWKKKKKKKKVREGGATNRSSANKPKNEHLVTARHNERANEKKKLLQTC